MNDRNEAVQALNIALAYTGPGAARERMLHDAAALARRVLLADDAEVNRLTELAQPGAWEYGLRMADDEEPYSDISEDLDWLLDGGLATVDEQIVRRRKAGPWEIHPMNRSEP